MKITCSVVAGFVLMIASTVLGTARLDETLQKASDNASVKDSLVKVVVFLENDASRYQVLLAASDQQMNRATRLKVISSQLRHGMPSNSNIVTQFLQRNSVTSISRHWIVPSITAEIPASQLSNLAQLPGIDQIIQDIPLELVTPVSVSPAPSQGTIASELQFLGVPSLWLRGITGKGRLVCNFDTGVDAKHPALAGKWRGTHAPLAASTFSMVHPDTLPYDNAGHGTHTMGIMCGSNGTDSFGVAPGAEWINAAVIDQGPDLETTISHILAAFEWALNPDGDTTTTDDVPDVILNSWGLPTLQPSAIAPCSTIFWQAIDNVESAGIVTIFAAGNEGRSGSSTIRNPANRASTPLNSFCVGAIGLDGKIADFSSRGPSSCDATQIKPEVVAPGLSIRSSTKGGGYAYMSGTSMAAPYIAGMVALCRQYNPDATVEQIKTAFIRAAQDLG
ncbi:MAG: S8 family serine peptidase, partial [Candidatus Zixiibacteriota bacterium]